MPEHHHTISDWMTRQPHTIGYDQPLALARARMNEHGIRHLPVLRGGHLTGIVTSRDIAIVESLPGVTLDDLAVEEAMTEGPWTVAPEVSLTWAAQIMAERRLGAAIVVAGEGSDEVVGVLTTTDALRALAKLAV